MARKSKYTPDVVARITEAIRKGATYELAAHYGGMSYETFRVWMDTKPAFSAAIKSAEGEAALTWLDVIEQAAVQDGNWQAAAWKLERRYPHMYGKTVQAQEHSGSIKLDVTHEFPDDPEAAALARAYAARTAHGRRDTGHVRSHRQSQDVPDAASPATAG